MVPLFLHSLMSAAAGVNGVGWYRTVELNRDLLLST